jgi:hypothetical protein
MMSAQKIIWCSFNEERLKQAKPNNEGLNLKYFKSAITGIVTTNHKRLPKMPAMQSLFWAAPKKG